MADTTTTQPQQVGAGAAGPAEAPPATRSLWSDAWRELRRSPIFWVSAVLIAIIVLMAIVPQLFTQTDPNFADLRRARESPSFDRAWFGMDQQGYDIYARTVYGARSSLIVGLMTTVLTVIIGSTVGTVGAYLSGWADAVLSRIGEIFFAIPLILGGVLFLYQFPNHAGDPYLQLVGKVVLVMTIISWPQTARVMRSSVMQVKPNDYVQAARSLGASPARLIFQHILPNAAAPLIVVATINLGVFIATEGTLSFLGIGLQPPAISWGQAISEASGIGLIRTAPHMLLFPSLFLSITVLAFIMLGDAVRDALDPKLR